MTTSEHFTHEPDAEYNARRRSHMTFHGLKEFARSPRHFKRTRDGLVPNADTDVFAFGRAAHVFILEGEETFAEQYAVGGPINEKTGKPYGTETKAFSEWAAEKGKPVVSVDQLITIQEMAASIERNQRAMGILSAGDSIVEGVVRRTHANTGNEIMDSLGPWQARIDYYSPTYGIADLKTTRNMDEFVADAKKYGYDLQMAFYREVIRSVVMGTNATVPCSLIAVENCEPFRCVVFELDSDVLAAARRSIQHFASEYANISKIDHWPDTLMGHRVLWTMETK